MIRKSVLQGFIKLHMNRKPKEIVFNNCGAVKQYLRKKSDG